MSEASSIGVRRCRTCEKDVPIPEDAIPVSEWRGITTYVIDGTAHMFTNRTKPKKQKETAVAVESFAPEIQPVPIKPAETKIEPFLQNEASRANDLRDQWRADNETDDVELSVAHRGFIKTFNSKKKYFFIESEGGEYFCHADGCLFPKGHRCMFIGGAPVIFDLETRDGQRRAVNVRLAQPPELADAETSIVSEWNSQYGFARRECHLNCEIYFNEKAIVTEGIESLRPGSKIYHKVKAINGRWFASDVEIFLPDNIMLSKADEITSTALGTALQAALKEN